MWMSLHQFTLFVGHFSTTCLITTIGLSASDGLLNGRPLDRQVSISRLPKL
jgi:hypothetical protein